MTLHARDKCYVTCGHKTFYDMTLSTIYEKYSATSDMVTSLEIMTAEVKRPFFITNLLTVGRFLAFSSKPN